MSIWAHRSEMVGPYSIPLMEGLIMFKVAIKIAGNWVSASGDIPRAQARRIANAYRNGLVSVHVRDAKVVRVVK